MGQFSVPPRIHTLDSLRGLAAFNVASSHGLFIIFGMLSSPDAFRWLDQPNLSQIGVAILAFIQDPGVGGGRAAVMLFFILSGFVLSLPFLRGDSAPSYIAFLIRRVCRIYIPFVFAIILAAGLFIYTPASTRWVDSSPLTATTFLRHLAMTGLARDSWLDTPVWSLVHEMRISSIFPLICLFFIKVGWRASLAVACSVFLLSATSQKYLVAEGTITESLVVTCRYILMFVAGISLARFWHQGRLSMLRSLPPSARPALWIIAIIFMLPFWWQVSATGADFLYGLGGVTLIALSLSSPRAEAILGLGPITWLGRVSYSLYLVHTPVAYFCSAWLGERSPYLAFAVFVIITAIVSELSFRWIEAPGIRLGRRLTRDRALPKPETIPPQD
jgi:peptidoglycan/LPS O-acetylase OafA/YrhL